MNLRVILLKKNALLHKDAYTSDLGFGKEMLGPWVTMGHFDSMYSYLLDTQDQNIFSVIRENNSIVAKKNDGDGYFHPLYLLMETTDEAFWMQDSWFIAVTRIHLASTVISPHDIKNLNNDIANQCKKMGCCCHIYQTIELSDLILVVKSDRINPMLDIVLNLWTRPVVGKVYTYCGIDYRYLTKPNAQLEEQNDIVFLSMRYAVRDSAKANDFFHFIEDNLGGKPLYSIAGVDDVIINFQNLKVQQLIHFFQNLLVNDLPENIDLGGAFSDITTRLGAPLQNREPQPTEDATAASVEKMKAALQQRCHELVDLNIYVRKLANTKQINQIDQYWLRSLSELSYSLLRLSRNALLDEFVYLMLPGIRAFLYNLKNILSRDDPNCLSVLDQEGCCRFVDHCAQLMEHIMRTEGQLAHHPEIRPILYDIPLAMLEHILAFLDLCSTILQTKDQPKKQIQFILLPRLCSEMKTEEIFTASGYLPGLLAISIPLHLMYDPQAVQIALCHEISHFVGENHRNRDQRRGYYIGAAAELIADLIFETNRESFIEQVRQRLDIYISNCQNEDTWTISDYGQAVQTWIDNFLYSPDLPCEYGNLIRDTLISESSSYVDNPLLLHADFVTLRIRNINYFAQILPVFTMLFREVFADICMVSLLDLDENTYLDSFYDDISENPTSAEFYAVRVFTTLTALDKPIPRKRTSTDTTGEKQFFSALKRLTRQYPRQNIESVVYQFPLGCILKLQLYSDCCVEKIKDLLNSEDVKQLRRMYKNVIDSNMKHQDLQQFIQEYRKRYLGINLSQQQTE